MPNAQATVAESIAGTGAEHEIRRKVSSRLCTKSIYVYTFQSNHPLKATQDQVGPPDEKNRPIRIGSKEAQPENAGSEPAQAPAGLRQPARCDSIGSLPRRRPPAQRSGVGQDLSVLAHHHRQGCE